MFFILWTAVFLLGCVAQSLILSHIIIPGVLVYGLAGVLSYLLLSFPQQVDYVQALDGERVRKNDLDVLAGSLALVLLFVCLWLIGTGSLPAGRHSGRLLYGLIFWIGFVGLIILSVRRPILMYLQRTTLKSHTPLFVLIILSFGLGLYRLTDVPITVHGDEGMVGIYARALLSGKVETFFSTSWYAIPQFFYFIPACGLYMFGDSVFGLRISTVLVGTLTIIPFYFLARSLWGKWSAFAAGLLLVTNHWFLHLMHCGVNYVQASFFAITVLALCFFANRKRSIALLVLAGLVIGIALQSYQANHILPLLWVVSQVWFLILRKISWKWCLASLGITLVVALLTVSPLFLHDYVKSGNTAMFSARAQGVIAWNEQGQNHLNSVYQAGGDHSKIWREQVKRALLAPILFSDTSMQYGGQKPFLDRITSVLFMLAFFVMLIRFYDVRWSLPFGWLLAILIAGGALTVDTPFYPRLAGTTALYFLVVSGLISAVLSSGNRSREISYSSAMFTSVVVLIAMVINLHAYFIHFANETSPVNVHYAQTRLAYYAKEKGPQTTFYVLSGSHFKFNSGTVHFVAPNVRGFDLEQFPPTIESGPVALVVDESKKNLIPHVEEKLPEAETREFYSPVNGQRMFTTFYRD